jgi:hypothetical protein
LPAFADTRPLFLRLGLRLVLRLVLRLGLRRGSSGGRGRSPGTPPGRCAALAIAIAIVSGLLAGCSPIVRPPDFAGARDHVAETSLVGPFDGQIVDGTNSEPVGDATVVGVWSYDRGDGLIGPGGSETLVVRSDRAGRYRITAAPAKLRGRSMRLVAFTLFVYKRATSVIAPTSPTTAARAANSSGVTTRSSCASGPAPTRTPRTC